MTEELTKYNLFQDYHTIGSKRLELVIKKDTDQYYDANDEVLAESYKEQMDEIYQQLKELGCEDLVLKKIAEPFADHIQLRMMPLSYGIVSYDPIGKGHKIRYRIKVGMVEYHVKPDIYEFMHEISKNKKVQQFHAGQIIEDLHIRKRIMINHDKLKNLFDGEKMRQLQKKLFKSLGNGEYITKIKKWL